MIHTYIRPEVFFLIITSWVLKDKDARNNGGKTNSGSDKAVTTGGTFLGQAGVWSQEFRAGSSESGVWSSDHFDQFIQGTFFGQVYFFTQALAGLTDSIITDTKHGGHFFGGKL